MGFHVLEFNDLLALFIDAIPVANPPLDRTGERRARFHALARSGSRAMLVTQPLGYAGLAR